MKIHGDMNLDELAMWMGPEATREDAAIMAALLLAGDYDDPSLIPLSYWSECLEKTAAVRCSAGYAIRGSEYLAFVRDHQFWPGIHEGRTYAEGLLLVIDQKAFERADIGPETIGEHSIVTIVEGDVFEHMVRLHSMLEHFGTWQDARMQRKRT